MAKLSINAGRQITPRDLSLLTVIGCHPFTTEHLLRISETFDQPFTDVRLIRRRLAQLRDSGFIRDWPLASISRGGSPRYWKLTRRGFRLLHGHDATLPTRRYFEEVSLGHHVHTRFLGDFVTHLFVSAHRNNVAVQHFARENSVQIKSSGFTLYPDCAFQLIGPKNRRFHYVVELDNGTERVRSKQDVESIERKIRGYLDHQSQFDARDPNRFVVLFITTRSGERLNHILEAAQSIQGTSNRTVFLGSTLEDFLNGEPFFEQCLQVPSGETRSLIPPHRAAAKSRTNRPRVAIAVP